jgi:hypothetical protein
VRQRIELTGTNSSIVLIALISNAHLFPGTGSKWRELKMKNQRLLIEITAFAGMFAPLALASIRP